MATEIENAPADFRREVVAGGFEYGITALGGILLAETDDDVVRSYGPRVYELMGNDPACSTAMAVLIAGSLADGPQLSPAVKAAPGEVISQRKRKADIKLAEEVCEFNKRGIARLDRPVEESLEDWSYDALTYGASAMEQTYDYVDDETGKARLMLRTLAVKPRFAWSFRVDGAMRVEKFRVRTISGAMKDLAREKMALFTWQPRYRDPRGRSIYRPAYTPWNYKVQEYPDFASYLKHFADPSLILEAGENWADKVDPATGAKQTVGQQLIAIGKLFKNQSILGLPFGAKATLIESKGTGEAYHAAFDRWDREIFRAILLGTRPVMEAEHGSKADSNSGMDLVSLATRRVRKPLSRAFRDDVVYWQTRLNYGKEVADRLTPDVSFGTTERDLPALLESFADAYQKGLIKEGVLPWVYDLLGIPAPPEGFDPKADPNADPKADPNAKTKNDPNAETGDSKP